MPGRTQDCSQEEGGVAAENRPGVSTWARCGEEPGMGPGSGSEP